MTSIIDRHWASRHLDAEMGYMLQSLIETARFPLSFRSFSDMLAEQVTRLIHEREPETAELFIASDLAPVSGQIFRLNYATRADWFKSTSLHATAEDLTFAWLSYIHALKLGAPSPVQSRRDAARAYNPFGNEGGFCNPIKLKLLAS